MKKVSAIVLAVLMLMMAAVPFASAEEEAAVFTMDVSDVAVGDTEVTVTVNYETALAILNGKMTLTYDATKLEVVVPIDEEYDEPDESLIAGKNLSRVGMASVNLDKEGEIIVGFVSQEKAIAKSGVAMAVTFKLKGVSAAAELPLKLVVNEWTTAEGNAVEGKAIEVEDVIAITEPTEAPTAAPTEAPTAAPTAAPTEGTPATGEATPWALLTVTALAGAALVGLTMKRK